MRPLLPIAGGERPASRPPITGNALPPTGGKFARLIGGYPALVMGGLAPPRSLGGKFARLMGVDALDADRTFSPFAGGDGGEEEDDAPVQLPLQEMTSPTGSISRERHERKLRERE
jgi:hypothetical protein